MLRGKNMRNKFYIGLIGCLLLLAMMPFSRAVGVARPFFSDNTFDMEANESDSIGFQLQNGEDTSKTLVLKISAQNPFEIEGGSFYEKQFTLASGEVKNVPIEFYSEQEGLYRVDYGYSEVCSGGGTICFNTEITDSFFVQVGDDDTYYGFDIPLVYGRFRFNTESRTITDIDDLVISSNWSDIDFSDSTVDLTGFREEYVDVGQGFVSISSFPGLNYPARIMFRDIESNYRIYKDGILCPLNVCENIYYTSSNKKLYFDVTGFSRYEVRYDSSTGGSTNTGGNTGGSTGGIITPPRNNTNNINNTPVMPEEPVVNHVPVSPNPSLQPANISKLTDVPSPFVKNNKSNEVIVPVSTEGKLQLIKAIFYGFLALIFAGILLYYVGKNATQQ